MAFVAWKFFGADPQQAYQTTKQITAQQQPTSSTALKNPTADQTEAKKFVATVLADTEDVWTQVFKQNGMTYTPPKLVLYTGATHTACGQGQAAMGPFYCPTDKTVYLDTAFFKEMRTKMNINAGTSKFKRQDQAGDFALAYVISHEVGHHIQTLLGVSQQIHKLRMQSGKAEGNKLSVRQELQADCFAGVWAKKNDERVKFLEQGDVEEALDAAHKIGDDYLQKSATGQIVPDSFTHGTSQQRMTWFNRGFQQGTLQSCDTFNQAI